MSASAFRDLRTGAIYCFEVLKIAQAKAMQRLLNVFRHKTLATFYRALSGRTLQFSG